MAESLIPLTFLDISWWRPRPPICRDHKAVSSSSSSSSSSRTTLPLSNKGWTVCKIQFDLFYLYDHNSKHHQFPVLSPPPYFLWFSNNKDLQWKVGWYSSVPEKLVPPSPCRARPLPQVKGKFPTVQSQGPDQDGASTCWPAKGINFCMTNVLAGTILQWLNYDDFIFGKDFDKAIYQQWLFLHGIAQLKLF